MLIVIALTARCRHNPPVQLTRTDLADFSYFLAIAKHRSFRRAGLELGVSASALSHALKGLESRIGVRLLAQHVAHHVPHHADMPDRGIAGAENARQRSGAGGEDGCDRAEFVA